MNELALAFSVVSNMFPYFEEAEAAIAGAAARASLADDARRIHYDGFSALQPSPLVPSNMIGLHFRELVERVAAGHYHDIGAPTRVEIARAMVQALNDNHGVPTTLAGAAMLQLFGDDLAQVVPAGAVEMATLAAGLEDPTVVEVVIQRYRNAGFNTQRQQAFEAGVARGWPK